MVVTTKGVILKRRNIGEQDVILTVLTDELGIIEASARGVKKTKSKLSGGTQPFCYSDLSLTRFKDRYIVTGASAIESFYKLRYDVVKVALADYAAELIGYLSPAGEQLGSVKRLYLNMLYLLCEERKTPAFLKAVFELRLLSLSGFMPDLVCCHECAAFENVALLLNLQQGYLLCENCLPKEDVTSYEFLTPSLLAALRHIIYAEDGKEFGFTASDQTIERMEQLIERYTLYHTERSFRPLELYRALISEDLIKS